MRGRRGIGLLLAALLAVSLPVLIGCAGKPGHRPAEKPEDSPDATKPQIPDTVPEENLPPEEETVRVAIQLAFPSVTQAGYRLGSVATDEAAKAYQKQVREEQEKMIRMIEETLGHPIAVKQRLTLTTNVISANVFPADIDAIRLVEGVVSVTEEIRHEITDGSTPLPAPPGQTATG